MLRESGRFLYNIVGHLFSKALSLYTNVLDIFAPPKSDSILFVAHPDDDTLFFYTYITRNKPYIVLLTSAGVIRRICPFIRAMKKYGVRFRAYDMSPKDITNESLLTKRIQNSLKIKKFNNCITHNVNGEYGHPMHRLVHNCVKTAWGKQVIVPCNKQSILKFPLTDSTLNDKIGFMKKYYKNEFPTLSTFDIWISHEGYEEC